MTGAGESMYTVCVRDHFMIAHSFSGEVFGPAQKLHGATYAVEVEFRRPQLDGDGIVVDIGRAGEALAAVLADLNYRNLDDEPKFTGINTTTEALAHYIFERMAAYAANGELGEGGRAVVSLSVRLDESPAAWASFEGPIGATDR
jgi:6-pyruvoyl-tetrahydropterin synthase